MACFLRALQEQNERESLAAAAHTRRAPGGVSTAAAAVGDDDAAAPADAVTRALINIGPLQRAELLTVTNEDVLQCMACAVSCPGCRSSIKARLLCGMAPAKNHALATLCDWDAAPHSHAHGSVVHAPSPSRDTASSASTSARWSAPSASVAATGVVFRVHEKLRADPVHLAAQLAVAAALPADGGAAAAPGLQRGSSGTRRRAKGTGAARRCHFHSMHRHIDSGTAVVVPWEQAWQRLTPAQRREVATVPGASLERALEAHLRHHRFCPACSCNLWCVFDLLMGSEPNWDVAARLGFQDTPAECEATVSFARPLLTVVQPVMSDSSDEEDDDRGGSDCDCDENSRVDGTNCRSYNIHAGRCGDNSNAAAAGDDGNNHNNRNNNNNCGGGAAARGAQCPLPVLAFREDSVPELIALADRMRAANTRPDGRPREVHATSVPAAQEEIKAGMGRLLRQRVHAAESGGCCSAEERHEAGLVCGLVARALRGKIEQAAYEQQLLEEQGQQLLHGLLGDETDGGGSGSGGSGAGRGRGAKKKKKKSKKNGRKSKKSTRDGLRRSAASASCPSPTEEEGATPGHRATASDSTTAAAATAAAASEDNGDNSGGGDNGGGGENGGGGVNAADAGLLAQQARWMGISVLELIALRRQLAVKKAQVAAQRARMQRDWSQYCGTCGVAGCSGGCVGVAI